MTKPQGSQAHKIYGQQVNPGEIISAVPRSKFNFSCRLTTVNSTSPIELERIANVTMPSYTPRTQTLNSYNKKVVVQSGYDYSPITLTAYDTRDAAIETFLKDYARYYFDGPMNIEGLTQLNQGQVGYKPRADRNFIKTFVIERKNSEDDTNIITIFNPFLTNIDADNLDYSDSGLVQYRLTFTYEGYNIESR